MANFHIYFSTLLDHEGGYVDDPNDKGGATKYGITFKTWLQNGYDKDGDGDIDKVDLKLITPDDAEKIAKKRYWDVVKGDEINSQSIAEFLFDFAYNSGPSLAVAKIQRILKVLDDGILGPKTLSAINNSNYKDTFEKLVDSRLALVNVIASHDPSQKKYLKGWINRINSFKFKN